MGKKKPIDCAEVLGGCGAICIEVGYAIGYPKDIVDHPTRVHHEYRYTCPNCGKEWIHDTLLPWIYEVPEDAQFHIKLINREEILETKDQRTIEYLGLKPKGFIKLTPKEFSRLLQEKWRKLGERR